MNRPAIAALVGSIIAADAAQAASIECDVLWRSPAGGTVEIKTGLDAPGASETTPLISWHPPSTNSRIDLNLSYWGSSYKELRPIAGGNLDAVIGADQRNDALTFEFGTGSGPDELKADVRTTTDTEGRRSLKAIASFRRGSSDEEEQHFIALVDRADTVTVTLKRANEESTKATFNLGATKARDNLIGRAKAQIDAVDSRVCKRPDTGPLVLPPVKR